MSESEARELVAKADKKASSGGGFFGFGGSSKEEAADLYERAGNAYKLAKNFQEAGNVFMKEANLQISMGEKDDAAQSFVQASKAYRRVNPTDAVNALHRAVSIMTERGRFHAAATHEKEIATIYEVDLQDLQRAMEAYDTAADWFLGEGGTALANKCRISSAHFAATLEQYSKAVKDFEDVAKASMDNHLTKYSVKEYLYKAGLCHLANGDSVAAKLSVQRYSDMDMTFPSTRECIFLTKITHAVDAGDMESFMNELTAYDQTLRLDTWQTTMLLRIKKQIADPDDLA